MRRQENGAPGYEYGIDSRLAPDFGEQLRIACVTVAHRMDGWTGCMYRREGHVAVMSNEWIEHFAAIWAPVGASNDPHGKNASWPSGVISLQRQYARAGSPMVKLMYEEVEQITGEN